MHVDEGPFKQAISSIGLSVESGTEAVPNDGAFYVLLGGEVLFQSKSKARALAAYRERRDELLTPEHRTAEANPAEALRREMAYFDAGYFRLEASKSKAQRAQKRGGKSQGGGVRR